MVGSSLNYVVFRPLVGDSIPLTMDIKTNNFVEVPDHVFAVRFKLHAHSLLVERELHDTKGMVVDAIFQQPMCISSCIVYKVFVNNYKIHNEDVTLLSQFPPTSSRIVTCKINNLEVIQVKVEPHNPPIVFDLSVDTNDDNAIMIPNLTILYKSCTRQCCSQVYSSAS